MRVNSKILVLGISKKKGLKKWMFWKANVLMYIFIFHIFVAALSELKDEDITSLPHYVANASQAEITIKGK